MFLSTLEITYFRNIIKAEVEPNAQFNLFYGDNGSGKSSLLEAIHYLSLARSFRTSVQNRIIHHKQQSFSLFGRLEFDNLTIPIGISKDLNGKTEIRISGKDAASVYELASTLPLQFIDGEAHFLIAGGPKHRREFLDWGVFHVEHHFFTVWQRHQRALKQRNALLRTPFSQDQIRLWDQELINSAYELNTMREKYFLAFKQEFERLINFFLPNSEISFTYSQGWPENRHLSEVLKESLGRDIELGYTQYGPQKADLIFRIKKNPVADVLSQGQQKMMVYALRLAQGLLLERQIQKKCIYLLDDLPSELDPEKRRLVAEILVSLGNQIFITGINHTDLTSLFPKTSSKLFHVEHGTISEIYSAG